MRSCNTDAAEPGIEFSPAPLLDAFERFQGSFFDLDRQVRIFADELRQLKTKLHRQMLRHGLTAGDRILAALPNGPLFAAVWAASLEAGACPVLVHGETPEPELQRMAARWGARFIVAEPQASTRPSKPLDADQHGTLSCQALEDTSADTTPLRSLPLHPTSGTSGGPKIAVRPGPCAVAEPLHYIETLSVDRSDRILCAVPMSHAYAYGMCFLVTLLASAQLVFMRRFNPAAVHRALDRMRISIFPAVPIMLDFLLAGAARFAACPRIVLSAGAPLAKKTFEGLSRRYGIWTRSLYGTTETGGISIGQEEAEWNGSVGVPMKGVEVELCVPRERGFESDARIVRVRSASMMAGYLEGSTINRNALSDGWFETGDLGRVDAQGRIYLHGRLSEVINVFGYKVVPREVEEVILMLPEVLEVKVYAGRYSNVDTVEAAVVCHEGLDESLVIRHCEKHLVSYKCPTAVRFVDSLPRTAAGKVAVERLHGAESH